MQENDDALFADIIDEWLAEKQANVKVTTFERYQCITNALKAFFKGEMIKHITNDEINNFISVCKEKGWNSSSLLMTIGIMKSITQFAKDEGYIQNLEPKFPRIKRETKPIKKLTVFESRKLNKKLNNTDSSYEIGILIALNTGLRIGEICSLKWKDIDLTRKRLIVRGTVHRVKAYDGISRTQLVVLSPKTTTSVREIPIPNFLCSILTTKRTDDNFYVLSGSADHIPEPRTVQRKFKEFCNKNLGINMNFHCLRHTFATLAISKGIDEKTVSELLGHSSVAITLKIYRGVNFDDKLNGIRTLEAFIGPKNN